MSEGGHGARTAARVLLEDVEAHQLLRLQPQLPAHLLELVAVATAEVEHNTAAALPAATAQVAAVGPRALQQIPRPRGRRRRRRHVRRRVEPARERLEDAQVDVLRLAIVGPPAHVRVGRRIRRLWVAAHAPHVRGERLTTRGLRVLSPVAPALFDVAVHEVGQVRSDGVAAHHAAEQAAPRRRVARERLQVGQRHGAALPRSRRQRRRRGPRRTVVGGLHGVEGRAEVEHGMHAQVHTRKAQAEHGRAPPPLQPWLACCCLTGRQTILQVSNVVDLFVEGRRWMAQAILGDKASEGAGAAAASAAAGEPATGRHGFCAWRRPRGGDLSVVGRVTCATNGERVCGGRVLGHPTTFERRHMFITRREVLAFGFPDCQVEGRRRRGGRTAGPGTGRLRSP